MAKLSIPAPDELAALKQAQSRASVDYAPFQTALAQIDKTDAKIAYLDLADGDPDAKTMRRRLISAGKRMTPAVGVKFLKASDEKRLVVALGAVPAPRVKKPKDAPAQ